MKEQSPEDRSRSNIDIKNEQETETETEKILCPHCQRTTTNGIKCKGICVSDSDY
jgi:hypothetical protein